MAVTGQVGAKSQAEDKYVYRYDNNAQGQVIYEGSAEPGASTSAAVWKIRKFTYDANGAVTSNLLAGGKPDFATTWTGRASASYS